MESRQWQCKFKSTTYIPYLFSFASENQQFNVIKFGETHWKIIQITSEHASEYRLRTLQASSQFYYALKTGFSNLHGNLGKNCTPVGPKQWEVLDSGLEFLP